MTNNLQSLVRDLRQRISSQRRTWMLFAAPELAGAIACVDLLLLELEAFGNRVDQLEASYHELVQLIRSADVVAHARDLDRAGFLP